MCERTATAAVLLGDTQTQQAEFARLAPDITIDLLLPPPTLLVRSALLLEEPARQIGKRVKVPREEDPRNPNHRLAAFLDEGSLELITEDDDSGMLAATGTVGGQPVVVFASDATIMGGAMGVAGCKVVVAAYERALADGVPVLGLWHSGGARLPEGVVSLHAVGEVFAIMTRASGKIPQISVVIGAAAGGGIEAIAMQVLPLVAIMVLFYFLLIRPQMKRTKEHRQMLEKIAKGDEVVTNGGLAGKVASIGEAYVTLEVAEGVSVKVQKASVGSVLPKGTLKTL